MACIYRPLVAIIVLIVVDRDFFLALLNDHDFLGAFCTQCLIVIVVDLSHARSISIAPVWPVVRVTALQPHWLLQLHHLLIVRVDYVFWPLLLLVVHGLRRDDFLGHAADSDHVVLSLLDDNQLRRAAWSFRCLRRWTGGTASVGILIHLIHDLSHGLDLQRRGRRQFARVRYPRPDLFFIFGECLGLTIVGGLKQIPHLSLLVLVHSLVQGLARWVVDLKEASVLLLEAGLNDLRRLLCFGGVSHVAHLELGHGGWDRHALALVACWNFFYLLQRHSCWIGRLLADRAVFQKKVSRRWHLIPEVLLLFGNFCLGQHSLLLILGRLEVHGLLVILLLLL